MFFTTKFTKDTKNRYPPEAGKLDNYQAKVGGAAGSPPPDYSRAGILKIKTFFQQPASLISHYTALQYTAYKHSDRGFFN